ncbi:MAG: D-glycerate dehydrogenase [Gammaproteobacteria bacterium]|nr:D-glycerate dehydrogenase [Gammaproteobacteria bacterium]
MSDKPAVLVTRKLPDAVQRRLARDYRPMFNEQDRRYETDELLELAADADAILACHTELFSREVINRLPERVRAIANFSVGVDHVDLDAARDRGITVTNTPDVLADATAELTILLMLGAARRAGEGERMIRDDKWNSWSPSFMVGVEMTGKRLGIIGMGRVGRVTARRARGFDMEIHYHNRSRLEPDLEAGAVYHETVEALLPNCDFLAMHCPGTPENKDLLNAERIDMLPDGAVVTNAARGSVVDEQALVAALKSGKLAAAGLDVYKNEPGVSEALRALDNAFLLPHIGSATRETRDAMGYRALDNLDAIFAGREPGDRVA